MTLQKCLVFSLIFALLGASLIARAQDASDGTLHVLRPIIHAEQDKAELCLEFDHPLVMEDQTRVAGTLRLETGGKNIPVASRMLSVSGNEFCLPGLDHRKDYRLTLASLRGAGGEKLGNPYSLSFTVPARHPALTFVNNAGSDGAMRWRDDDPVLRAINVPNVKLELYHVTDPARMAEAWGQRMQTTLAPSESATFARSNGALAWQGELSFDDAPDKSVEQQIPLNENAGTSPPGLYLLIASAPELREKKSYLIPTAASWLARSNMKIRALGAKDGIYALADKADASAPVKDAHFMIIDHGQQTLAEGKSGENGIAFLSLPNEKRGEAAVLIGLADAGDVDFSDLAQNEENIPTPPAVEATITTSKSFYVPAETANVTLAARDIHNNPVPAKGSTLQLLRPDRSFYTSFPASGAQNGLEHIVLTAPALNGVWPLVWQGSNGQVLAEGRLCVSANPDAPRIEMSSDRNILTENGETNVTLKSVTDSGTSAPYIAGRVFVNWGAPDHIFPGWEGYHFGTDETADHTPAPAAFFVTDANGVARLHLKLPPPEDASPLHEAILSVISDPAAGAADPPNLVLPVKPGNFIVGIKPLASGGRFSENSLARFDVIALDSDGKRRGADDLSYQIFEEGRSFDWYQSEGRWDFKPLEQQRRVGGGTFSIAADNIKHLEWPVTAGAYRLDIAGADGHLLARVHFSAGWGLAKTETPQLAGLELKPSVVVLQPGKETGIHFVLEKPALVTAVIADDRIRSVFHTLKAKGDNTIAFTPAADWGNRVSVWVSAEFRDSENDAAYATGQVVLPLGPTAGQKDTAKPKKQSPSAAASASPKNGSGGGIDIRPLRTVSEQTLAPQRSWAAPAEKKGQTRTEPLLLFAGPEPIYALPSVLAEALNRHPFTTAEIADQLDVFRLWHDVIVTSSLLPEAALRERQDELLLRLIARQQSDGSFPSLPGGKSDLTATAAALTALSQINQPVTAPAKERAADWLHRQLENTWFDEAERPARAAAYAALAAAGNLDASSLNYFADTSGDKPLPPLAAAQLAAAFAVLNDKDKASYWLGVTRIAKNAPSVPSELLPLLDGNVFFDPHDSGTALKKLSDEVMKKPHELSVLADFLRAVWHVQDRAGSWRISVNKNDRNVKNVLVISWPEKTVPPVIRNTSARSLYFAAAQSIKNTPLKNVIERRIVGLNGEEASGALKQGETYIVTLQGPWPGNEKTPVFVHDDPGPGLLPTGCVPSVPDNDFLSWLRGAPPTLLQACEQTGDAIGVLIEHADTGSWKVVYLAKAEGRGSYDLEAPGARALSGTPNTLEGHRESIRIK